MIRHFFQFTCYVFIEAKVLSMHHKHGRNFRKLEKSVCEKHTIEKKKIRIIYKEMHVFNLISVLHGLSTKTITKFYFYMK